MRESIRRFFTPPPAFSAYDAADDAGSERSRRRLEKLSSGDGDFLKSTTFLQSSKLRSVKQRHRAAAMAVSGVGVSMAVVSSDLQQQRPVCPAMRHAAATKQSHGGGGLWCHRPPPAKAAQRRQTYGLSPLLRFKEAERAELVDGPSSSASLFR
nr:hypothetical protein Iba_chr10eCG10440 [Ipomoea batatas]